MYIATERNASPIKVPERIAAAGNKLVTAENRTKAEINAQASQTLLTLANRKGPISEELTRLARQADGGGKFSEAGRDFADFVRRNIGGGDAGGDQARAGLRGDLDAAGSETEKPARLIDNEQEPGESELAGYAEPGGDGQAVQVDALETEIRELLAEISETHPGKAPKLEDVRHPETGNSLVEDLRAVAAVEPTHLINTPERLALCARIAEKLYQTNIEGRRQERILDLILGPPASGKSTI
ncbi:MAG: hypothetical protein QF894_10150 [Alphaproteobacteria bacterium]|nr:hypothetical protein [Alphaproteobacteria bacterium]